MLYKKINIELIVLADEAEPIIAELNSTLDRLDETYSLFGGEIESVDFKHAGKRRRSALAHTVAASETALSSTRKGLSTALRAII